MGKLSKFKVVDGAYNIKSEDKTEFVVNVLMPLLMKNVKKMKLTEYDKFSKARKNIPDIFIDGKKKAISNLSKFIQNRLNNPEHITGLTLPDKDTTAANKKARRDAVNLQSKDIDLVDKYDWNSTPELMEGHHKRAVKIYAAFYEGLDPDGPEAKELTQFFVDEGFPLGDHKSNIEDLTVKEHKEIHRWMQEHGIQVPVGKPGQSNFLKGGIVRGGVDHQLEEVQKIPRPIFPSMKGLDINARRLAASDYLEYVQKPVEEEIKKIKNKVTLYRPSGQEISRMKSLGLEWNKDLGKFEQKVDPHLMRISSNTQFANKFSIGPEFFNKAHSTAQQVGSWLGGPFAKISTVDQTINAAVKGDTVGAAVGAFKALSHTENLPLDDKEQLLLN